MVEINGEFVDELTGADWYEDLVCCNLDFETIVEEISRFFSADQCLEFWQSLATDYELI